MALDWQAGLFYFEEDYDVESFSYDSLNGNAQDGYERINQTNDSWACSARRPGRSPDGSSCAEACATPGTRRNSR